MPRNGSSQEEEEFRKALTKTNVRGALGVWGPIVGSGAVGFFALLALYTVWPFSTIPVIVLLGAPLVVGVGAFVGLQKLFP